MSATLDELLREMIVWSAGFVVVSTLLILAPTLFRRLRRKPVPVTASGDRGHTPLPPTRGT